MNDARERAIATLIQDCETPEEALKAVVPNVDMSLAMAAFFVGKFFHVKKDGPAGTFEVNHKKNDVFEAFGLNSEELTKKRAKVVANVAYRKALGQKVTKSLYVEELLNNVSDPLEIALLAITLDR